MFKTIKEDTTAEIVEKKSKFIANVFYIESQEEAEEKIKMVGKKYFDARHNCYAYSIFTKNGIVNKFSDDGEPSGTAGAPMLNILTGKGITNVLVVVTRYFGGILLGTGGLVRAYTGATQEALEKASIIEKDLGIEAEIEVSYPDLEKCKYYLNQKDILITDSEYSENIKLKIETTEEKLNEMEENKHNLNFSIINKVVIKEKYIII